MPVKHKDKPEVLMTSLSFPNFLVFLYIVATISNVAFLVLSLTKNYGRTVTENFFMSIFISSGMILPLKVLWNEKGLYWQILRYLLLSFFLLAIFVTYNSGKAALLSDFTQAEGMMVIAVKHISPPYYSAKMDANLIINPILDLVHRGEEDYYRAGESTYGILLQIENSPMEWKTRHLRLNKFNKSLVEARFQEFLDKKIIVNYFNNLTNDLIFVKSIGGCYIYNEQDPTYTNPNVNYCK